MGLIYFETKNYLIAQESFKKALSCLTGKSDKISEKMRYKSERILKKIKKEVMLSQIQTSQNNII